ncbi:hypothetical protein Ssi03_67330 [Sphaerisporangium siamense]|uniref:DUF397 domain-containing protein n=1 Tax=Sphaerisporangium siamense TaxID=795645 RepID=A0A7W7DDE8_9ACTN|nr:DUF397 domain-containing protein [Sphaerisporangium siamense]MBB4704758.1 hypothetical protein [Sphaerisporangium siamense]GII88743.1 hypothetical protein Ssi03_67330 [Sphaerisporangium siamense]
MEPKDLNPDLAKAVWRKPRRSGVEGGNCVETTRNLPGVVAVRDSKVPDGPVLVFGAESWSRFVAGVKGAGM